MVLSESRRLERSIEVARQEVRCTVRTQVLLFPKAASHRLQPNKQPDRPGKKTKRD